VDTGRLEAFSDGVFAVAITLLALDLAIGGPAADGKPVLAAKLGEHWPSFAAYAVSFATIGIIWVNHHALVRNFARIDRPLLFINLLLLFFVVSIPFATSTIAAYLRADSIDASLAAALYNGVFEAMSISFTLLFWWAIRREHLRVALTAQQGRQATIRFGIGQLGYLAGIAIAFVSAPASLALSALVAVAYIFERTPAAERRQPEEPAESSAGPGSAAPRHGATLTARADDGGQPRRLGRLAVRRGLSCLRRKGAGDLRELAPGTDAELLVGAGKVGLHRPDGDEQGLGHLPVRQARRGQLGDPALRGSE
jgi:TMEM175 potassium channel family protein